MNCLIIDDNPIARTTLRKLSELVPDLKIIDECASAAEAYRIIISQPIDLLFLDIEMPDMTGLELAKSLENYRPIIIFTTSKKEYAVEAFELNVADYITKPVTPPRFLQATERAQDVYRSRQTTVKVENESFIFIRDSNVIRRIQLDDVLFAEAMGDYVKLYTPDKMYSIHSTLKEVEAKLPIPRFMRVHRSFIVQISRIDSMEGSTLVIHNKLVPVADTYRTTLNKRLSIL
jgi:DNA-binding LytR/AlgR family response regulator